MNQKDICTEEAFKAQDIVTYVWCSCSHIDCHRKDRWTLQDNYDKLGYQGTW